MFHIQSSVFMVKVKTCNKTRSQLALWALCYITILVSVKETVTPVYNMSTLLVYIYCIGHTVIY